MAMLAGSAHLVVGTADDIPGVLALVEKEGIETHGNPDVYVRAYAHFGVEEARELRERACLRAFTHRQANARAFEGGVRVFVVAAPGMTVEAQNALLKTLEEPPADAVFFFITPAPQTLLATLRSRTQNTRVSSERGATVTGAMPSVDTKKFLSATHERRLDMLKPLLEKGDDDLPVPQSGAPRQAGKRDIGAIVEFLSSLERTLAKDAPREGLKAVYRARKYVIGKGALVKPLLEQVALLTPKV